MSEAPYFVWVRNDGYVGCTRYKPNSGCNVLFVTPEWAEAKSFLEMFREENANTD